MSGTKTLGLAAALGAVVAFGAGLARAEEGTIVAWGNPLPGVPTDGDFVAIAGGSGHGLALRSDGSLAAWGYDNGDGVVSFTPDGSDFVAIAAGDQFNVAVRSDGTAVAWGTGDPAFTNGLDGESNLVSIAAGTEHIVGLRGDGTVLSYTVNDDRTGPEGDDFVSVAAGWYQSFAIRADGSAVAWASTGYGDGYGVVSGLPTDVSFRQIATGVGHAVGLRTDGGLVSWGLDSGGVVSDTPDGTDFVAVAAGHSHSLALRADGSIVAWGTDAYGETGATPKGGGFVAIAGGNQHSLALAGATSAGTTQVLAAAVADLVEGGADVGGKGGTSLVTPLEKALEKIADDKTESAVKQLEKFIDRAEQHVGGELTQEQVDALVEAAEAIIDSLSP
jgi:hypothetical protein